MGSDEIINPVSASLFILAIRASVAAVIETSD